MLQWNFLKSTLHYDSNTNWHYRLSNNLLLTWSVSWRNGASDDPTRLISCVNSLRKRLHFGGRLHKKQQKAFSTSNPVHKNVWLNNNNNNYWYTNTNNFQTLVNLSASLSLHLTIRLKVFISEGITLNTISWETMQKTLLTVLQCMSEIIQFTWKQKSLCTRKEVCAVYTFLCMSCCWKAHSGINKFNLFCFLLKKMSRHCEKCNNHKKWMDGWMDWQLSYSRGTWYLSVSSPDLGLHVNSLSISNKTSIKLIT